MTTAARRIVGIDIARALAIIGMVMAHVQPRGLGDQTDLLAMAYRSVNGRAAILFGLLAGIGISILDRRAPGHRRTHTTMVWRALVLFPMGLWLQSLDTPVAVILQYYAWFFLVGAVLVHVPDRILLVITASATIAGPLAVLGASSVGAQVPPTMPEWWELHESMAMIAVVGYYPLVTWAAPLALGMWLGRRDLTSVAAARALMAGGAVAVAAGYVLSTLLRPQVADPIVGRLFEIEPHNQMPLWIVTATGAAVAVLGLSLLVGSLLPRVTEPVAAAGRLAFTIYVGHLLVFDLRPGWLGPNQTFGEAIATVGWFTLITLVLSFGWQRAVGTGPLESLLRLPRFWVTTRSATPSASPARAAEPS